MKNHIPLIFFLTLQLLYDLLYNMQNLLKYFFTGSDTLSHPFQDKPLINDLFFGRISKKWPTKFKTFHPKPTLIGGVS